MGSRRRCFYRRPAHGAEEVPVFFPSTAVNLSDQHDEELESGSVLRRGNTNRVRLLALGRHYRYQIPVRLDELRHASGDGARVYVDFRNFQSRTVTVSQESVAARMTIQ